nr:zinc-binding dehydrogenase [Streptomyces sp. M54]
MRRRGAGSGSTSAASTQGRGGRRRRRQDVRAQRRGHGPDALPRPDAERRVRRVRHRGGVGHLALQLATWKGARTIAVASGAHERFLRELGADAYIDYTKERPEDVVRDADVVLDAVGGPTSRRFLPALKRGGSLFPVYVGEFDEEENARFGVTVTGTQVRANGAQLAELATLVDAGTIRVAVDSVHPLGWRATCLRMRVRLSRELPCGGRGRSM